MDGKLRWVEAKVARDPPRQLAAVVVVPAASAGGAAAAVGNRKLRPSEQRLCFNWFVAPESIGASSWGGCCCLQLQCVVECEFSQWWVPV